MSKDCPFCNYSGPAPILETLAGLAIVFSPVNPVTVGHVLVVPKTHLRDASEGPRMTGLLFELAAKFAGDHFSDYNLITSKGEAATQSVGHLHVHVIPRQKGDGIKLPWSRTSSQVMEPADLMSEPHADTVEMSQFLAVNRETGKAEEPELSKRSRDVLEAIFFLRESERDFAARDMLEAALTDYAERWSSISPIPELVKLRNTSQPIRQRFRRLAEGAE